MQNINLTTALSGKLSDKKPLYETIAGIVKDAVNENFRTEGRRLGGGGWTKLAKSTLKQKEKKGFASILRNTGRLQNSVIVNVDESGISVSSPLPYANIHQYGGTIPIRKRSAKTSVKKMMERKTSINIPARPYMDLTKSDMERIYDAVRKWMRE